MIRLVVFLAAALAVLVGCGSPPPVPAAPTVALEPPPQAAPDPPKPLALHIPAIGVNAPIEQTGIQPDQTLEVPDAADVASWYTGSPEPGQFGPSVLLGHVDYHRQPGVFAHLDQLRPGDDVLVDLEGGTTARFVVSAVERHPKSSFPTDRVYGDTDQRALRLITCGGVFDHGTGHYVDNVIVWAEIPEDSR